jgi:hypothetical protein
MRNCSLQGGGGRLSTWDLLVGKICTFWTAASLIRGPCKRKELELLSQGYINAKRNIILGKQNREQSTSEKSAYGNRRM